MSSRAAGEAVHGDFLLGGAPLQNCRSGAGVSSCLQGTAYHRAPVELGPGKAPALWPRCWRKLVC